nr:hypothetical protein [Methylobacterium sp. ZNC0032]
MPSLETLRRRRLDAKLTLAKAEACPKKRGRGEARRAYIRATAAIIRAEINRRIAAPLLHAKATQRETGDLFSQIGA